jgi:hypothetical protein
MNTFSPLTQLIFDNTISFDTANHVFNMHTDATNATVFFFFFVRKLSAAWLFLRLEHRNTFRSEALKSRILPQRTSFREVIGFTINDTLIMAFSFPGCTQAANGAEDIGDQNILDGVLALLSTIMQLLFIWITRPVYRSFCSIMEKKGGVCVRIASDSGISSIASTTISSL